MKITSLVTALPQGQNTGWTVAGRQITEELKKIAFVTDLNDTPHLVQQDFPVQFNVPLIQSMRCVDMIPSYPHLVSDFRVGYGFAEENLLLARYACNATIYWDSIVVGSTWAKSEMIRALNWDVSGGFVTVAVQGVDGDVFCPNESVKPDPEWFTIFSGGKFEFRKGQDVVIRAAAVMMERHSDVRLIASWWNPWQQSSETMRQSKLIGMASYGAGTMRDIQCTPTMNGIPADRIMFLDQQQHEEMAAWMNRCDVGLFPNRCEAGTNLVMMEAMSCGLPVIATTAHGHADVCHGMNDRFKLRSEPFTVERGGIPVAIWHEPDLEQTIEALEQAYRMRGGSALRLQGELERNAMKPFTWAACAQSLLKACQ